jgi:DNA-binding transcriptional MerR regulator
MDSRMSTTHDPDAAGTLRRINEVAVEVGLTPRAIRYYEEQGLLTPTARSAGAYRLFDDEDMERLRTIKAFRDDAGFSVAEIAGMLADRTATQRAKVTYTSAASEAERRQILTDALERLDRQLALIESKVQRLARMRADISERRQRVAARLAETAASE